VYVWWGGGRCGYMYMDVYTLNIVLILGFELPRFCNALRSQIADV
jgi:hypothetical protein